MERFLSVVFVVTFTSLHFKGDANIVYLNIVVEQ